jgi:hypothetical protein
MVKSVATLRFKNVSTTWGMTAESDPRLTNLSFGHFKSPVRQTGEKMLIQYMCDFSQSREARFKTDFDIALAVAAPGTGKTRTIDDMLRVRLPPNKFQCILRLGFSFNGFGDASCRFEVGSRAVREFFCGPAIERDSEILRAIDERIVQFFIAADPNDSFSDFRRELLLLDAVEMLFARAQGHESPDKCRSVLLIDELSCARNRDNVYGVVKTFVDDGVVPLARVGSGFAPRAAASRRGAFFTGLSFMSPWEKRAPGSGRTLVQIPLGTLDVWDPLVQAAIVDMAKTEWPTLDPMPDRVWSLMAATGGRPRDIIRVIMHIKHNYDADLASADQRMLLNALLLGTEWSDAFARNLLPSLLGVKFCAFKNDCVTSFGGDVAQPALLNADVMVRKSWALSDVPVMSLMYARSIPGGVPALQQIINALVTSTTFCILDGSGKDFERVWIGMTLTHLLLQHVLRTTVAVELGVESESFAPVEIVPARALPVEEPNRLFWPRDERFNDVDFPRPSTKVAINVFAADNDTSSRIEALFPCPNPSRVHVTAGASIRHKVSLRQQPSLAVWHDLWSPTVVPGNLDALPAGWPAAAVVEWKPGTVVYLSKSNNAAVDSLLLVGDAEDGSKSKEPHVFLFQFNAHGVVTHGTKTATAARGEPSAVRGIVKKVWRCLDRLLSREFSGTHVLRRAGINRMSQVTLCIATRDVEPTITLNEPDSAVDAPFNVVLLDAADLVALGGPSFGNTLFFRKFKE